MEESSGLNVIQFAKARASEIASLVKDVNRKKKTNATQNLPPHMRRRAASHNPKRIPRKLRKNYEKYHAESKSKKAPKKMRKQQQKKKHEKQAKNYPIEYAKRSRDGELWLGTHIWHAKRCKMDTLWGYKLPIHCNDKKLGATHQAVTKHAMLLDLSYYCCISLEGPEDKLLECLSSLTDLNSGSNFASATYLDGLREGHAYVYHPFKLPYEAIGLVTFIWKPVTDKSSEDIKPKRNLWIWCHPSFHDEFVGVLIAVFKLKEIEKESVPTTAPDLEDVKETDKGNVTFNSKVNLEKVRQHFFKEDIFESEDVQMTLLKDKLMRFRIIGPNAQNVVTNVLETADVEDMSALCGTVTAKSTFRVNGYNEQLSPDNETLNVTNCNESFECTSESKRTCDDYYPAAKKIKLDSEDCKKISKSDESNLNVKSCNESPKLLMNGTNTEINSDIDLVSSEMLGRPTVESNKSESQSGTPEKQCWWKHYYNNERAKSVHRKRKKLLEHLRNSRSGYYIAPSSVIGLTVRDPRLILSRNKEKFISTEDNETVKDVLELLAEDVADSPLWNCDIRDEVTATQIPESEINDERAKYIIPSESQNLGDKESRVPILLIHQPGTNGFGCGWDLIAPLGWSMAFWIPLVLNGGRVVGLRDLHFANLEIGQPSFPLSYPDTKAGEEYEEAQRVDKLTTYYKRPKAKRPNFATFGTPNPYFIPWNALVCDWIRELKSYERKMFFSGTTSIDFKVDISESDSKSSFFVLRQKEVRLLQNLLDRLNRLPRGNKALRELENLKKLYDELVLCTLTTQNQLKYSLVLIKIKCLSRGCPTIHSGIYALDEGDMKELKCNPNFLGPKEPNHTKYKKGDKLNSEGKDSDVECSKKSDTQTLSECQTSKDLERPQIESLKSFSSHKMIGYLSEGGFSSISGKGCGIGHCSLIGLLCVIKDSIQHQLRPVVLVREQHSFQYRVSSVEIIPNYL